jgi:cytochrome c-type biogenesis protein CcmF
MGQVGQFSLALAFVVTIYSIAASLLGIRIKNDRLIASGRNAAVAVFALITAAIGTLAYLFITNDFLYAYVAGHSNRDLPTYFKISSIWGGQEGSLLFWGWLLTIYTALVVIQNRRKHMAMMPYVTSVLMGTSLFFTSMHLFVANPFKLNAAEVGARIVGTFTPGDGQGLNALLQDPMMVIHPPMLYLGFVGMVVPFAFAIAALITRQLGDTWIRTTRRWTMAAWGILGTGILLGGSGGECIAHAMADWHGVSAFRDGSGKERNAQGLEHRPGDHVLHHGRVRHIPHAQRGCEFGSRLREISDRRIFPGLYRDRVVRFVLPAHRPSALS